MKILIQEKVSSSISYERKAAFVAKSCHVCGFIWNPNFTWKSHLGKHQLASQQHWRGASSHLNLVWQVQESSFFSPKPHSSAITDMTALWLLRWWLKPIMPWKCHSLCSSNFNFVPCSQRHHVPGCISVVKSRQCHYLLGTMRRKRIEAEIWSAIIGNWLIISLYLLVQLQSSALYKNKTHKNQKHSS